MRIRDPFVLPDPATKAYYIYSSTTHGIDSEEPRKEVVVYASKDLESWEAPKTVSIPPARQRPHDGGHPMLFRAFDGRLLMAIHQPNRKVERARFFEMDDSGDGVRLLREATGRVSSVLINSSEPRP